DGAGADIDRRLDGVREAVHKAQRRGREQRDRGAEGFSVDGARTDRTHGGAGPSLHIALREREVEPRPAGEREIVPDAVPADVEVGARAGHLERDAARQRCSGAGRTCGRGAGGGRGGSRGLLTLAARAARFAARAGPGSVALLVVARIDHAVATL